MKAKTVKRHSRILKIWRSFIAPTPKKWAKIRTTCASFSGAIVVGWGAIAAAGLSMPDGYEKYVGITIGILAGIASYAQSHSEPKAQTK